jgi:tetratricopeptide (TPR) repeat protein
MRTARQLAAAVAILACAATPVLAAPKKGPARAEFDRGVAAYTKGDYAAAADALGKSFALEADAETLFAWAQTERKLDRCDKAIELYGKLLQMKMPDENKEAVRVQIEECKAIIAAAKPEPTPDPKPDPAPEPGVDNSTKPDPQVRDFPTSAETSPAWWENPVGGALVGLGVVAAGVGTVFLVQGKSADSDKANATTYNDYEALNDKAESRGQLGVIGLAVGGALITGGVIWYATHKPEQPSKTVSGWLAPSGGGGLVVSGRF